MCGYKNDALPEDFSDVYLPYSSLILIMQNNAALASIYGCWKRVLCFYVQYTRGPMYL
jgi:hypothetical protein